VAAASFVGTIGFVVSALLPPEAYVVCAPISSLWPFHFTMNYRVVDKLMQQRYGCLIIAVSGTFSLLPPLLGWVSSNVDSTATAGLVIAINTSLSTPGQLVGAWIYNSNDAKTGYTRGHWINASLLLTVSVTCVILRLYYARENRKRAAAGQKLFVY